MLIPGPTFQADGNINNFIAVMVSPSNDNRVLQVSATNQFPIGVSQQGMNQAPGSFGATSTLAATQGQSIQVYCAPNVAQMIVGAAVTRGNPLTINTSGQAVPLVAGSPSTQYIIGIALMSQATVGATTRVLIIPQQIWF